MDCVRNPWRDSVVLAGRAHLRNTFGAIRYWDVATRMTNASARDAHNSRKLRETLVVDVVEN